MNNIERTFLVVDNYTNEVLAWYDDIKTAKAAISLQYEESRIVRAVYENYDDNASSWACGKTFAEAEKNLKKGIFDNWDEF